MFNKVKKNRRMGDIYFDKKYKVILAKLERNVAKLERNVMKLERNVTLEHFIKKIILLRLLIK